MNNNSLLGSWKKYWEICSGTFLWSYCWNSFVPMVRQSSGRYWYNYQHEFTSCPQTKITVTELHRASLENIYYWYLGNWQRSV